MKGIVRLVIITLLGSIALAGCRATEDRGQVPGLSNVYNNLSVYWETVAESLGFQPRAGGVSEWSLSYDGQGNVLSSRLTITVAVSSDQQDRYSIVQQGNNTASWERRRITSSLPSLPAQAFFNELDAVGYQTLEKNLSLDPPIWAYFRVDAETVNYSATMHPRVVHAGRLLSDGTNAVSMQGSHGWMQLKQSTTAQVSVDTTAASPGDNPSVFLFTVGCNQVTETPIVWKCSPAQ